MPQLGSAASGRPMLITSLIVAILLIFALAGLRYYEHRPTAEKRYAQLAESVADGICVTEEGRVVFANVAMAKLVGLADPRDAYGRPTLDFIDFQFHNMVERGRTEAVDGVLLGPTEIRLCHSDGTRIPAELRVMAIDGSGGSRFLNVVRDLTARRAQEAELRMRGMVLDRSTDGVIVANARGRVVYANRAFYELCDIEPGTLLGRSARAIWAGFEDHEIDIDEVESELRAGKPWRGRYAVRDERGLHHRDMRCFPVSDEDGRPRSLVAVLRDTTDEVDVEERSQQTLRLEAVGQLAGGMAHGVNDQLTVILGHAELLAGASRDPGVREHAQVIGEAAERSAAMARQLLAVGQRRALDPRLVDVASLLREQRDVYARLVPERIAMQVDLAASLPAVKVDPNGLQQAVLDLVLNARDAISGSGCIRVAARATGTGVEISVEDDGCGMDARTRGRMFEPFFSTRPPGEGIGLGLATTHGLVRQSGGTIEVESEPGQGTRLRILLPEAEDGVAWTGADASAAAEGHETVLVVESEERLRALAHRTLRGAGYRVLEAADAESALERARLHGGALDLVVADVVLPGLDGVELVNRLRQQRPSLRALLLSGYVPDPGQLSAAVELGARVLEKPFRMRDLRLHVRDALDRPTGA